MVAAADSLTGERDPKDERAALQRLISGVGNLVVTLQHPLRTIFSDDRRFALTGTTMLHSAMDDLRPLGATTSAFDSTGAAVDPLRARYEQQPGPGGARHPTWRDRDSALRSHAGAEERLFQFA